MKARLLPLVPAVALIVAGTLAGCGASTEKPAAAAGTSSCSQQAQGSDPLAAPALQQQELDPQLAASVPAAAKGTTVTFGVAPDLPPVNFGKDGQQRGFEPDLLRAAGQRIGVTIQFKMLDNPLQAYSAGQVDGIAGFFNDTKERQKLGSFIDYVNASVSAITAPCNPQHITQASDLCGKKVTAAVGTVQLAQITSTDAPKSLA